MRKRGRGQNPTRARIDLLRSLPVMYEPPTRFRVLTVSTRPDLSGQTTTSLGAPMRKSACAVCGIGRSSILTRPSSRVMVELFTCESPAPLRLPSGPCR